MFFGNFQGLLNTPDDSSRLASHVGFVKAIFLFETSAYCHDLLLGGIDSRWIDQSTGRTKSTFFDRNFYKITHFLNFLLRSCSVLKAHNVQPYGSLSYKSKYICTKIKIIHNFKPFPKGSP